MKQVHAEAITKDTRFYLDVKMATNTIVEVGYGDKHELINGNLEAPQLHRIFVTEGQYNKFLTAIN